MYVIFLYAITLQQIS